MRLTGEEDYLKSGWWHYPEEFKEYFLAGGSTTDPTGAIQYTAYDIDIYGVCDLAGLCVFWLHYWHFPAINKPDMVSDLISHTTGLDIDLDEALKRVAQAQLDKTLKTESIRIEAEEQEVSLSLCHSLVSCGVYSNPNTMKSLVFAYLREAGFVKCLPKAE